MAVVAAAMLRMVVPAVVSRDGLMPWRSLSTRILVMGPRIVGTPVVIAWATLVFLLRELGLVRVHILILDYLESEHTHARASESGV
jgi:hypothetical protein